MKRTPAWASASPPCSRQHLAKNWADIDPPSARPADALSDPTSTLPAWQLSSPSLPADAAARGLARVGPAGIASLTMAVLQSMHDTHCTSSSASFRGSGACEARRSSGRSGTHSSKWPSARGSASSTSACRQPHPSHRRGRQHRAALAGDAVDEHAHREAHQRPNVPPRPGFRRPVLRPVAAQSDAATLKASEFVYASPYVPISVEMAEYARPTFKPQRRAIQKCPNSCTKTAAPNNSRTATMS